MVAWLHDVSKQREWPLRFSSRHHLAEWPEVRSPAQLISISNSARRSAPRVSRFFALSVFFDVTIAFAAPPTTALATDKHGRLADVAPILDLSNKTLSDVRT
jgi:hypothetical protein